MGWRPLARVIAAATRKLRATRKRASDGGWADLLLRGVFKCAEYDRRDCVTVRLLVSG